MRTFIWIRRDAVRTLHGCGGQAYEGNGRRSLSLYWRLTYRTNRDWNVYTKIYGSTQYKSKLEKRNGYCHVNTWPFEHNFQTVFLARLAWRLVVCSEWEKWCIIWGNILKISSAWHGRSFERGVALFVIGGLVWLPLRLICECRS